MIQATPVTFLASMKTGGEGFGSDIKAAEGWTGWTERGYPVE